jgi:hypothetical protein
MCALWAPGSDVGSCYGPRGRSKLLVGMGGSAVVTRDGGQLLQHACSKHPLYLPVVHLLLAHGARHGDGAMGLTLVLSDICDQLHAFAKASETEETRLRVHTDAALRRVLAVWAGVTGAVQEYLVSKKLWRVLPLRPPPSSSGPGGGSEGDGAHAHACIDLLWKAMLVSATNSNTANQLIGVMVGYSILFYNILYYIVLYCLVCINIYFDLILISAPAIVSDAGSSQTAPRQTWMCSPSAASPWPISMRQW